MFLFLEAFYLYYRQCIFEFMFKEMDEKCKQYKTQNQHKIMKEKEGKFNHYMMECRYQVVETYRSKMDSVCEGMKSVENLQEFHAKAFENARNLYTPHVQEYGSEACLPFIYNSNEVNYLNHFYITVPYFFDPLYSVEIKNITLILC
jgi:hypothetical protein